MVWQDTCWTSQSQDNQVWGMMATRSDASGNPLFVLVNVKSQLCMDIPGYGTVSAGAPVSLYACASNSANDNQEWYKKSIEGAEYLIVNEKNPNLCLDVSGSSSDGSDSANRAPLTVYTCVVNGGYDDHSWWFDNPTA